MKRTRLKPGRRKPRPSLMEFHGEVIARAGWCCEMASPDCYGGLWGHHFIPKQRLKHDPAAYVDPRNGVALCVHHHSQVEAGRIRSPRPPELDAFLADYDLVERAA